VSAIEPNEPVVLLYNPILLLQTDSITMPLAGYEEPAPQRLLSRRGLVVLLAISALTISLASRVSTATFVKAYAVQSSSTTAKIQHLDKDAAHWVAPTATFTLLWATEPSVAVDGNESVPVRPPDDSLHNRPPPIS
jgi:hypothetical protein